MKIFVLLLLCFFVVGCQAEDKMVSDETVIEDTVEEIVEEVIEETLEAPLHLFSELFGKTPEEVIQVLGVEPKYDEEDTDVIGFYEGKISAQFREGKLTYFLLFPEIKILDFILSKDISEDDVFNYFGNPDEKGKLGPNDSVTLYEYQYPEKKLVLVFFFDPEIKEMPAAVGVFEF